MNNKTQLIFVCRFPAWGEKLEFPAFGVKYLVEVPIENSENEEDCIEYFKIAFKNKINKDFDGEILFVEEVQIVLL